jgi:hypothetical protein
MEFLRYNWFPNTYNSSQQISVLDKCNSISFTNTGDETVTINGVKVLYPGTVGSILGDSFTIGGNYGEILSEKRISISFAGGGANPQIEIDQKVYV